MDLAGNLETQLNLAVMERLVAEPFIAVTGSLTVYHPNLLAISDWLRLDR